MIQKYILFMGDRYYPWGGWKDYLADFDTISQCQLKAIERQESENLSFCWFQIVDSETKEIVLEGDFDAQQPFDDLIWKIWDPRIEE